MTRLSRYCHSTKRILQLQLVTAFQSKCSPRHLHAAPRMPSCTMR